MTRIFALALFATISASTAAQSAGIISLGQTEHKTVTTTTEHGTAVTVVTRKGNTVTAVTRFTPSKPGYRPMGGSGHYQPTGGGYKPMGR
jgi:hypothetical protein